jgi:hypothetical protein
MILTDKFTEASPRSFNFSPLASQPVRSNRAAITAATPET